MIEIRQSASDRLGFRQRLTQDCRGNSSFEFIHGSVIFQISRCIEDCSFGRHGRVRPFLQLMIGIAQGSPWKSELGHVIFDRTLVFTGVGVNQVEGDVAALELLGYAPQLWRGTVGGGAIRAKEQKDLDVARQRRAPAEQ